MKCRRCDHKNPDDTNFCGNCGAKLAPPEGMDFPTQTLRDKKPIPGRKVAGKYRLLKELGRGGMGVVYEALDEKLKRTVALKFLPQDLIRDREARERFMHEAQAASQLDHPNICTVHEIGEDRGRMYIAMACYRGESLKKRLQEEPLPIDQVIDLALQAARGLAKAHEKEIVHRDIKPANMIITTTGW